MAQDDFNPPPAPSPPDEEKIERKLPIAFQITLFVTATTVALLVGLIWAFISSGP